MSNVFPLYQACKQSALPSTQLLWSSGSDFDCYRAILVAPLPWVAAGFVILTAVTALVYLVYPRWQTWHLGLQPIDRDELPDLALALDQLCQTAGLQRSPEFLWNPLNGHHAALAFGTRRHRRIALSGKDVVQFYDDPAAFRGMLLHELAHIRNGDVGIAYLALSIFWAFLATGLVPLLLIDVPRQAWLELALSAFNTALYILMILVTLKALLRARELYADARSFAWHQDLDGLNRLLGQLQPVLGWRQIFSPHPAPPRRRRLVENTDEMFRFGAWEAFGVGLASTFMILPLLVLAAFLLGLLGKSGITGSVTSSVLLPTISLTVMIGGSIAVGTWRATFLALAQGQAQPSHSRVALACAAGITTGTAVYTVMNSILGVAGIGRLATMAPPLSVAMPSAILVSLGYCLVVLLTLTLVLMVLSKWVAAVARCWLGASLLGGRPGVAFGLMLTMSLLVWALWFGSVLLVSTVAVEFLLQGKELIPLMILVGASSEVFPFVWIGVVGFWLIPLSSALRSRSLPSEMFWMFPKGATETAPKLPAPPTRLRRTLLFGLAGGIVAIIVAAWIPIPLSVDSLQGTGFPVTNALARQVARLVTGELVAGLVAAIVVIAIPRLSIVHAACAAFIAGGVFCIAEVYYLNAARLHAPALGTAAWMAEFKQTLELGAPSLNTAFVTRSIFFIGTLIALLIASITYLLTRPVQWLVARFTSEGKSHKTSVI